MTTPDEGVYLNAARQYCLSRHNYDGPYADDSARERHIDSDARSTASDSPAFRAAVESVWRDAQRPEERSDEEKS